MSFKKVMVFLAILSLGESQDTTTTKHEIAFIDAEEMSSLHEILASELELLHQKIDKLFEETRRTTTTTPNLTTTTPFEANATAPPQTTTTTIENNDETHDLLKWFVEQRCFLLALGFGITTTILTTTILAAMICLMRKTKRSYDVEQVELREVQVVQENM